MPVVLRYLLVTVLVIAGSPVNAADTPLRMAMMALAPYAYKTNEGKWKGNLFDVSQAILKEGHFAGDVRAYPVKRLTTLLKRGEADCTITAAVPYMKNNYTKVASLNSELEFGVLPHKEVTIKKYDALNNITIAVPSGAKMGLPFDADEKLQKVQVQDYENAMRLLSAKRVDAAAGVISSLMFSAKMAGLETMKFGTAYIFHSLPINVYCQPGTPIEAYWPKIKNAVIALQNKGVIKKIMQAYNGTKVLAHGQ